MFPPDKAWNQYLKSKGIIENQTQQRKREVVMNLLRILVPTLISKVAWEYNLKRDDFQCQIVPFGSFGLGAHLADADMDVVFLGAWPVRRSDFFRIFPEILRQHATISDVEVIEVATVPIIRCIIDRIPVDIAFARLKLNTVPPGINLLENSLLSGLDEPCLKSLDGPRVHSFLMQQIQPEHLPIFQTALQCLKWWAKQRCIYDRAIGYLNGNAWTLLLAKTYMTTAKPSSDANTGNTLTVYNLLRSFFQTWSTWPWPAPVMLTGSIQDYEGKNIDYRSLVEFEDAVMPIVSPCYRVSNASPNVSKSTLRVITKELTRAHVIMSSEFPSPEAMMEKLFRPLNIVKYYTHFLEVFVNCDNSATFEVWKNKMPATIPRLIQLLEAVPSITYIHPYPKPFIHTISYLTRQEKNALQRGQELPKPEVEYRTCMLEPGVLQRACYLIGIEVKPSDEEEEQKAIDISREVAAFKKTVESRTNSKDGDLLVNVVAGKRKDIATIVKGK